MLTSIIVGVVNTLVTILFIGTSFIAYEVFKTVSTDELNEEWKQLTKPKKVSLFIMGAFPIAIYLLALYLMISMWIDFINLL